MGPVPCLTGHMPVATTIHILFLERMIWSLSLVFEIERRSEVEQLLSHGYFMYNVVMFGYTKKQKTCYCSLLLPDQHNKQLSDNSFKLL